MSWGARLFWVAAVLSFVGLVLLSPRPEGAQSTLALRRYLAAMGFEVTDAERLPDPRGTVFVLHDFREPDEAGSVLEWVKAGGKLVLADPGSLMLAMVDASPGGPIGLVGTVELEPGCVSPDVVGVNRLALDASDTVLHAHHAAFISCFPAGDGAYLLTRAYGAGRLTLLGGVSPLTNDHLSEADNAVLGAHVAAPGPTVVFAPPLPPGAPAQAGVWDALPEGARVAVVATVLAAVAFALVRGRRLGDPVLEEPVVQIPASELVRATARMYRRAGAVAHCGSLLRDVTTARFANRLGSAGNPDQLSRMVARTSDVPPQTVDDILNGPDPRTDVELIRLGRELEELVAQARRVAT